MTNIQRAITEMRKSLIASSEIIAYEAFADVAQTRKLHPAFCYGLELPGKQAHGLTIKGQEIRGT